MKNHTKWALAGSAVVALSLVSLQQTGALWSGSAAATAGAPIQAGNLDITAGNAQLDLAGFKLEGKAPGDSVQLALPVNNNGSANMQYKLSGVTVAVGAPPLQLRVAVVNDAAACTATGSPGTELYNNAMQNAVTAWRPVTSGSSEMLCVRATIGAGALPSQSGSATFNFAAESVAH